MFDEIGAEGEGGEQRAGERGRKKRGVGTERGERGGEGRRQRNMYRERGERKMKRESERVSQIESA